MTILYRHPLEEHVRKHSKAKVLRRAVLETAGGVLILVPISFLTSLYLLITLGIFVLWAWIVAWVRGMEWAPREILRINGLGGAYYLGESVDKFLQYWNKLDRELKLELIDIYGGVYQVCTAANEILKDDYWADVTDFCNEIDPRTEALKKLVTARDRLRLEAVKSAIVDVDSHALETARLYAESFEEQAKELR